ncbi:MAG: hypothetical protein NZM43_03495 [Saprospiraceae bacterium]|nr:hypothetical protein [Saprospiraceae bacterium]MDW8483369.1 hypothetical protein [Saprospiraceae bacterium]
MRPPLLILSAFILTLLLAHRREEHSRLAEGNCDPFTRPFYGYSFLLPEIINKNAAYAPFFTRWDDYYDRYYFDLDHQREENIAEWRDRFCSLAEPEEVDFVVYQAGENDLLVLRDLAFARAEPEQMPYPFIGNTFAETLAYNGCIEVLDYLVFTRQCEPYVTLPDGGWARPQRPVEFMQQLIEEGKERFSHTSSHFLRLRYAYQIVRLAHYAGQWRQTVDLYNELMPKIDRRRPSIVYYWILGHLAGALQRLGKTAEAAYRYSIIFNHCPSKRIQAFRSFQLRDEKDWKAALRLCRNDAEQATLYLLRAAKNRPFSVDHLASIYQLDPASPHLELMLIGMVQELERIFLHTSVTQKKRKGPIYRESKDNAAIRLIDLQRTTRRIAREGKVPRPKLWLAISVYLQILANDLSSAERALDRVSEQLTNDRYDLVLKRQIEVWRLLTKLLKLDAKDETTDSIYFNLKSEALFRKIPSFEPFAQELLSERYALNRHPGKAVLIAYGPTGILYNPQLEELDDLIRLAKSDTSIFLFKFMPIDTSMDQILARLLEIKGAYLLAQGQPEAALAVLSQIPASQISEMETFTPFKEVLHDKIHRPTTDSLTLNRLQIAEKLVEYERLAKASAALEDPAAAWYFYLIGLAYYNMSYFGHAWSATDFYRSGYNWTRLAQGPVFPLRNSPNGNRENIDVSLALTYFEKALALARNPEVAARAAFMAARCQQKQWFTHPDCRYRPGSRMIPQLPEAYTRYYKELKRYEKSNFYQRIVQECKWLPYYQ